MVVCLTWLVFPFSEISDPSDHNCPSDLCQMQCSGMSESAAFPVGGNKNWSRCPVFVFKMLCLQESNVVPDPVEMQGLSMVCVFHKLAVHGICDGTLLLV